MPEGSAGARTPAAAPVSVIMPVHNAERYLAEAVESVLAQTHAPLELIVIDDGSTDGSARIVLGLGAAAVRYEYQANAGQSAARNRGVELAQGALLAFLDDDDYWAPDKLARQVKVLRDEPTVEAVFGHVRQFMSPELSPEAARRNRFHAEIMPGYVPGAMLIRREAFERVGRFDPLLRVGEFVQWYAQAVDLDLRSVLLPDIVLHRRVHDDNVGIKLRAESVQYVRVLKAALDRRRARPETKEGGRGAASGE